MEKINRQFLEQIGITDEEVFQFYFPEEISISRSYVNPLREDDDHPSCRFYRSKDKNILYFIDPAFKNYDAYQFVMDMFRIPYLDACEKVYYDLGYMTGVKQPKPPPITKKEPSVIRVARGIWTDSHFNFWKEYDSSVTKDELEEAGHFALKTAWLNDKIIYSHGYGKRAFFYHLRSGYNYQLYNPDLFYQGVKFITTPNNNYVGWKKMKKPYSYAVITKSAKCTFFVQRFGINAVGQLTETRVMPKEDWDYLFEGIDRVFTLFDPDKTGKHLAWMYRKIYGTTPLFFDLKNGDEKDFSDNLKKYKSQYMAEYIDSTREYFNIEKL